MARGSASQRDLEEASVRHPSDETRGFAGSLSKIEPLHETGKHMWNTCRIEEVKPAVPFGGIYGVRY